MDKELYNRILRLDENEIKLTECGRLDIPTFDWVCEGRVYSSYKVPKKCSECLWFKNGDYLEYYAFSSQRIELRPPDPKKRCNCYEYTNLKSWELGGIDRRSQEDYERILPDIVNLYFIKRRRWKI